ncbi:IS200/IS605 family transposase [Jiulongibacter sediminis]|jgi:REP element-mobilizing transposase RayT|uniref:IS200/IS605 family transposase n=1 Tax=Jiulongibacter sediminis TaxID=1605367 RepID=UPI0026EDE0C4|nr:IS200/IS605 family transposase [Jiulongibacter sediminis]
MANTYRKVYLHLVFAVKNRNALLDNKWRADLFKYISKTLTNRGHFTLAVNGYHDHIHIFFDYNGKELIEEVVREIKKTSSNYIKERELTSAKFEWQSGYGVFSHGFRERDAIIKYIVNQEAHHSGRSFRNEYLSLLKSFEVDFKDEYVFDFISDK